MDTSEQYIKMSVQAWKDLESLIDKDQIDWRTQGYCPKHKCLIEEGSDGDSRCPELQEHLINSNFEPEPSEDCEYQEIWIPLLQQDQLQAMVRAKYELDWHLAKGFIDWVIDFSIRVEFLSRSMEQLWLAFVVKEKFNKVWDGKDWLIL